MTSWGSFVAILLLCGLYRAYGTVTLARPSDFVVPPKNIEVRCTISGGETFSGWYRGSTGSVIDKSPSAKIRYEERTKNDFYLIITQASLSDGGTYICRGTTGGSKTYTLNIEFDAEDVERTQYIQIGNDDTIKVDVQGIPQPTFTWEKEGKVVNMNTGRYSQNNRGTVSIKDVVIADQGNYTLKIKQMSRSLNLKIEVISFEPPIMVEVPLPATRYLTVGFNTTFHCKAKGYPPPKYQWLNRANKPVDVTNPRFIPNGEYFHIVDVQLSDKGTYTCEASNVKYYKVNGSAEIKEIYVRPTIQEQYLKDEIVERGDKADLDCVADGTPLPNVRWMRDGRFDFRQEITSRRSIIRIKEARMTDMGKYQCEATNSARDQQGRIIVAEATMGLYIKSRPIINNKGTQRIVYSYLGNPKPVYIRCNFEGYPFPNVTIWFDNIQIANGTEVAIFDIITNEMEDFGDYYCWSWNLHGSNNVTVQLLHAKPPSRPTNVMKNVTCNSVKLSWDEPTNNGGMEIVHYVIEYAGMRWNTEDTYPEYFIENLEKNKVYTIQIRARNKMGVGDHETVTITTKAYCRPGHPIIWHPLQTVISDTMFFLRWRIPTDDGGDPNIRYLVVINEDLEDGPYPTKDEEIGVTEYYVDDLKFGMKYYIEVYAINQAGRSEPAIGLYEVNKIGVMGLSGSSCLTLNLVTILLSSVMALSLLCL